MTPGRRRRHLALSVSFLTTVLASLLLLAAPASAHRIDESYIYMDIYDTEIEGRLEFRVVDINEELGLDLPEDPDEAATAVDGAIDDIRAYAEPRFGLGSDGDSWTVRFVDEHELLETESGLFVVIPFEVAETFDSVPDTVDVFYEAFVLENENHKGFFHIGNYWEGGVFANESDPFLRFFDAGDTRQTFDIDDPDFWGGLWGVVELGVDHIRIGTDHILFIVALLLPSVLVFTHKWEPAPSFSSALWRVIKIATSFTVAHSITLSLAGFGVVELPAKPVETIIAISIILAALHNFFPLFQNKEWVLAFAFGLFHGLGFAGLLTDLGLDRTNRVWSLFAFNVGVEIGQVVILVLLFPALFLLRRTRLYHVGFFKIGSVALMVVAAIWALERILEEDFNVSALIDPFVEVPRAYYLVLMFTVLAAGWRYREMKEGNLIWLPDAEDLEPKERESTGVD
ncbi:MAG: HupE/UreJ family protein [Actinomycetota bacterium]